jgi:hypothetical protein
VHAMRNKIAIGFAALMIVSLVVWVIGILSAVVIPLFGGIRADKVGQIGLAIGMIGECCAWILAWLWRLVEKRRH